MSLPIDRTAKATLDTNLNNGITSDAPAIKASDDNVYNTIDELYNRLLSYVAANPYFANGGLITKENQLINGNFQVWQDGTSFTATGSYTADQWCLFHDHTSASATQQETYSPNGSRYKLRLTNVTRGTGTFLEACQPIETMNAIGMAGKTVDLSLYVRKNSILAAGNFVAYVTYTSVVDDSAVNVASGNVAGSVTISAASLSTSDQLIECLCIVPSSARTISVVLRLQDSPTDGGYVEVSQVNLIINNFSLPIQPRDYEVELSKCQRYCEYCEIRIRIPDASGTVIYPYAFSTTKRAVPTLSGNAIFTEPKVSKFSIQVAGAGTQDISAICKAVARL
jgi:hypothetical protein